MSKENINTATDQGGLMDFSWDSNTDSFFGIGGEATEVTTDTEDEEEIEDPKKQDIDEDDPTPTDTDTDSFFNEKEEVEKGGKSTEDITTDNSIYTDIYKDLKEFGIFKHVQPEEDEDISAERLYELQQEEIEAEIGQRLNSWATEELDEDAQAFIKFKLEGGNTKDFFNTLSKSSDLEVGEIDDENYQDALIRRQLKLEGWDNDEIEDRLEYLTDNGKKEKFAEKYHNKFKQEKEKEKAALLKQTEEARKEAKQQEEYFRNNIKEVLDTNENLNGIKIAEKDKGQILQFLTKKDQKIDDKTSVTGFQRKLSEVFKDPNKVVLLAKLIKDDFDFSTIEKSTITKKTKAIKTNIEQRQNMRPAGSGSSSVSSGIASFFEK